MMLFYHELAAGCLGVGFLYSCHIDARRQIVQVNCSGTCRKVNRLALEQLSCRTIDVELCSSLGSCLKDEVAFSKFNCDILALSNRCVDGQFWVVNNHSVVHSDEFVIGVEQVVLPNGRTIHDIKAVTSIREASNGLVALVCLIDDMVGKVLEGRMLVEICLVVCNELFR